VFPLCSLCSSAFLSRQSNLLCKGRSLWGFRSWQIPGSRRVQWQSALSPPLTPQAPCWARSHQAKSGLGFRRRGNIDASIDQCRRHASGNSRDEDGVETAPRGNAITDPRSMSVSADRDAQESSTTRVGAPCDQESI